MSPLTGVDTVYVHGAGQQEHPTLLKRRLDGAIFGSAQGERTHLGYYSDILHGTSPMPGGLEALTPVDPVQKAADPTVSRAELVEALAGKPALGGLEGINRPALLAEALLDRADTVAVAEAAARPDALEGKRFPDLGFRIVVGILAEDVIKYLFKGYAERVREPVRAALRAARDPVRVVAHSLGTIVVFDVLSEPEFVTRNVVRLVTVGSPLGIENVQDELCNHGGEPHLIPGPVGSWSNLADDDDPVASGQAIAAEFDPNQHGFRIADNLSVENRGFLHHELTGYLKLGPVLDAILKL